MQSETIQSSDGTGLNLVSWPAPDFSRGNVLIVHGLAEHMGRYDHVAKALTGAGFSVSGVELRGHGDSAGKQGHVDTWSQYTEDLKAAVAAIEGEVTLVCHSMGCLVSLAAILDGLQVRAIALSNPLLGVAVQAPAIKVAAARWLSKLLPGLPMSNELDVNDISRDPDVVARYEADDKVFSKITPRWYMEMMGAIERVQGAAADFQLPLLLQQGDGDRITNVGDATTFFERWGHSDKKRVVYPGLFHEIYNEPEKEQVFAELGQWLQGQAGLQEQGE
jgi:alpha-beta hydrolase superfamily lysophospholipase